MMLSTAATCPTPFPHISGYTLYEQLYAGTRTTVYRAVQETTQDRVIIKLLQQEYPSFNDLLQFRNQYTITKNLTIPGIIRPYSLEPYNNSYALVMEDYGGISLQQYAQIHSLSVVEILTIALQLTEILHELHQQRVIHKDIKPANILIHPDSKQIKLIDFSIASLLPKETQDIKNPHGLEGTLAYLAPEQTGRMNRGIDYRADFYALGVTLYELLTGQLPFLATDPMALVHCHLAINPPSVTDLCPTIPPVLSAMVEKLMAKNAEDRYQSALGLHHDLQTGLSQLKETGQIENFVIATQDICDRFLIPEKLYGRSAEVQKLLDAFDRVAAGPSELMMVAGFSGIGKTVVVNEVHRPIVRQRGYFIKGKFDQFNRNIPFSAFVQAFRNLIGQVLSESDSQLQSWRIKILEALEGNAQVIIDVIPELEYIIGAQPAPPDLSGTAAQNRFNLLLQKFIQAFAASEHPLVIFLDDLQWADAASLTLMQHLMTDTGTRYLLVLGAYRDNEVFAAHPLMLTLEAIAKGGAIVSTITLLPLSQNSLQALIADTFKCPLALTQPLTELIVQKTQGNPFFATQFLKALYQDQLITFDPQVGAWQSDIAQVRAAALTDEVVSLMAGQLQKLPAPTQVVIKLAACIGNQFDLQTLTIISEQTEAETADALWHALQAGLIIPQSDIYKFYLGNSELDAGVAIETLRYKFLHDRVQQAAYGLIPDIHRATIHYRIGRLLLSHFSSATQAERIFELVGHLNPGSRLIVNPLERLELARLNLTAARKAMTSTAYGAALDYLNQGILQLPAAAWTEHYALTLDLHHHRLEVAYLHSQFEDLVVWGEEVLKQATSVLDCIKVYETRIMALRSQGRFLEVVETGLQVLKRLGLEFPEQPTPADIEAAYRQSRQAWQGREPLSLLELPAMENPQLLAAMQILTKIVPSAHIAAPSLLPLLSFKQVELSIQQGNSPISIFSYADYGLILCGIIGDIDTGYEFGKLSLSLLEKLQITPFKSRAYFIVNSFTRHWKEPLQQTLPFLLEGYRSGLDSGDWECVALNLLTYSHYQYWAGQALTDLVTDMQTYREVIDRVKQAATLKSHEAYLQAILNLTGQGGEIPYRLCGHVFDADQVLPQLQVANDRVGLFHTYLNQTLLCYWFEQYEQATQQTALAEEYSDGACGFFLLPIWIFYDALIHLSRYPNVPADQQDLMLDRITGHQEKLQGWATHAPCNHQHRYQLVAAEQARVLNQQADAIQFYDLAIATAKANGYLQEEALANELASKFYLAWGKEKVAASYLQEAYFCYARWGAKAKTDDLKKRYPSLLHPILQPATRALTVFETLETMAAPNLSIHASTKLSRSSSTSINDSLDFAAVLKASQSLSGTIQLDQLLCQLTQIILQNSGGDHCALIRPNQLGEWCVEATATPEATELSTELLDGNANIPVKLIQYVKNTQEGVVIDDLNTDLPIIDDYLSQHQPKSLLCLPILNQGHLIGILYLKNHSTSGVFTPDRILVLNFLCTQAAISLENARLYQQAQTYAQQLEHSQLQIVQSEKMASLGNLVAGVAHEVNNPIGFLNGSIKNAKDYVADLLEHFALYQQHYPTPSASIQEHAEEIDLEFLSEDLPKLIDSMKAATDRIKGISTSLRTFSRADTEHKVNINLHEGIDSTLLILKYRLKANEHRPAIQVIKDYGDLPAIACFPGQLNQVFMNILANAIDMFDEMAQSLSSEDLKAHPQTITLRTTVVSEQVQIDISDNGKGMTEAVQARIFDQLFTTKGVGKGTGLGLAIARQIVVEKHNGRLDVYSQVGQGTQFCIQLPIAC